MTTDNVEQVESGNEQATGNAQRSVSVLLDVLQREGTYQGMTDAEIQSLIDYEKNCSYMDGAREQLAETQQQQRDRIAALTASSLQAQETMLQSIIDRATNPQMQVVQYG